MFPELQPHFHPEKLIDSCGAARARARARAPRPGRTAGLRRAPRADPFESGREQRAILDDAAGAALAAFRLRGARRGRRAPRRQGQVHRQHAGRRAARALLASGPRVQVVAPRRAGRSSRAMADAPFDPATAARALRATRLGSDSSSHRGRGAAAAGRVAGAGGTFDGGGASAAWDGRSGTDAGGDSSGSADAESSARLHQLLTCSTPSASLARPSRACCRCDDARGPLRVLIASLAPGGAERIVLEWLAAEAARGREVELAVLHPRRNALGAAAGSRVRTRGRESPEAFLAALARDWRGAARRRPRTSSPTRCSRCSGAAACARCRRCTTRARAGATIPRRWAAGDVPLAVACAERVRARDARGGLPRSGRHACATARASARGVRSGGCAARCARSWASRRARFLVGAVGAHQGAEGLRARGRGAGALRAQRDASLVILGGVLDATGFARARSRRSMRRVAHGVARAPAAAGLGRPDRALPRGVRRAAQREPLRGPVDRGAGGARRGAAGGRDRRGRAGRDRPRARSRCCAADAPRRSVRRAASRASGAHDARGAARVARAPRLVARARAARAPGGARSTRSSSPPT